MLHEASRAARTGRGTLGRSPEPPRRTRPSPFVLPLAFLLACEETRRHEEEWIVLLVQATATQWLPCQTIPSLALKYGKTRVIGFWSRVTTLPEQIVPLEMTTSGP